MVAVRPKASAEGMESFVALRYEIPEAARMLRMSRAQLYNRISEGAIRPQSTAQNAAA